MGWGALRIAFCPCCYAESTATPNNQPVGWSRGGSRLFTHSRPVNSYLVKLCYSTMKEDGEWSGYTSCKGCTFIQMHLEVKNYFKIYQQHPRGTTVENAHCYHSLSAEGGVRILFTIYFPLDSGIRFKYNYPKQITYVEQP